MWKKLQLKRRLKSNKGFTLIEIIFSMFLIAFISLTIFYLLNYSIATSNVSNYKDEILSKGRYGFEYISGEIHRADKIIDASKIIGFNSRYPENLGFVIYNYNETDNNPKGNHEYTAYYIKGDILNRIKCRKIDEKYPDATYFGREAGVNFLSENIIENNTFVNFQTNIISLSFIVGNDTSAYKFESIFNMNCITDY